MRCDEAKLSFRDFLAVLDELYPTVVEVAGCIVMRGSGDEEKVLKDWINATGGDLDAAERGMNHRHLSDLLLHGQPVVGVRADEWRVVLRTYVALLHYELRRVLGEREFVVSVFGAHEIERCPEDCEITFSLVRQSRSSGDSSGREAEAK